MRKKRALWNEYRFPGFSPKAGIQGIFGDPKARVIFLVRRQKKRLVVPAEWFTGVSTIGRPVVFGICRAGMHGYIWNWKFGVFAVGSAGR
jgi:GR25 family glycosyltransferase involved in LPS biosynthesis